jgi:hypothetical protein
MSNRQRIRKPLKRNRNGQWVDHLVVVEADDDCPFCRMAGIRVEPDGKITRREH